jgi:hypothetical protein
MVRLKEINFGDYEANTVVTGFSKTPSRCGRQHANAFSGVIKFLGIKLTLALASK